MLITQVWGACLDSAPFLLELAKEGHKIEPALWLRSILPTAWVEVPVMGGCIKPEGFSILAGYDHDSKVDLGSETIAGCLWHSGGSGVKYLHTQSCGAVDR